MVSSLSFSPHRDDIGYLSPVPSSSKMMSQPPSAFSFSIARYWIESGSSFLGLRFDL
jgi:hypothetical protein